MVNRRVRPPARYAKLGKFSFISLAILSCWTAFNGTVAIADEVDAQFDGGRTPASNLPTAAPTQPIQSCSAESAAEINSKYGYKGWAMSPPSFADSFTGDYDCWRTNLAKYGIGLIDNITTYGEYNLLSHYEPSHSQQQYFGQRPSGNFINSLMLTYDLSRFGLPDGQLGFVGTGATNTWAPDYTAKQLQMTEFKVYGTALNKTIEYEFGYLQNNLRFQGTVVGGNVANPLGLGSASGALVGQSASAGVPSINVKWNIDRNWYDRFAVQRSLPGTVSTAGASGNMIAVEILSNPSGFNPLNSSPVVDGVRYHSPRALFINEIGYQHQAGAGDPSSWVRLTGYYNTTTYADLSSTSGGTVNNNYAVSLYADRQIWQSEPSSAATAYKGIYIGGTLTHNNPRASSIASTVEARIYSFGLFNRPEDQIALSWQLQLPSSYMVDQFNASSSCKSQDLCMHRQVNSLLLSYTAHIRKGLWFSAGLQYTDNPSLVYSPLLVNGPTDSAPASLQPWNIHSALSGLVAVYANF